MCHVIFAPEAYKVVYINDLGEGGKGEVLGLWFMECDFSKGSLCARRLSVLFQ